jgi:hypothetical protein
MTPYRPVMLNAYSMFNSNRMILDMQATESIVHKRDVQCQIEKGLVNR